MYIKKQKRSIIWNNVLTAAVNAICRAVQITTDRIIRRMIVGEVAGPCQSHLDAPAFLPSPLRRRCRLPNLSFPPSTPSPVGVGLLITLSSVNLPLAR